MNTQLLELLATINPDLKATTEKRVELEKQLAEVNRQISELV